MQNIFDLFNDRKQGIMSLVEGTQYDGDEEATLEGIDLGLEESFFAEYAEVLESLTTLDPLEEGAKLKALGDKVVELDEKFMSALYTAISKVYKNPDKLRKVIARDKDTVETCEQEIMKRKNESDENKIKAMTKEVGRMAVFTVMSGVGLGVLVLSNKTTSPTAFLKRVKKCNEIFIKAANKRIAELEEKAVKEAVEGIYIEESFFAEYEEVLEAVLGFDEMGDLESLEESVKEKAKQAYNKLEEFDDKLNEKVYSVLVKLYKNPDKLRKVIERDSKSIEKCENILKQRKEEEDNIVKAIVKEATRMTIFGILSNLGVSVFFLTNPKVSPSILLRNIKRYNTLFIKVANKRIAELEEKATKESAELVELNYESLEEALVALDGIIKESSMEFIEFQSANYLEDLVLESMMYEEFNEEKMEAALEATMSDRMTKAADGIKAQWAKLAAWFEEILRIVTNLFVDGAKLVKENSTKIGPAMKACSAKVNMVDYKPLGPAIAECNSMMIDLKGNAAAKGASKASVLGAIGAKDDKSVSEIIRKLFMSDNRSAKSISSLNPNIAMSYAGEGKQVIDAVKKTKAIMDKDFKEIERVLRSQSKDSQDAYDAIALFKYASNLRMRIVNQELACIKKGHYEFIAIIKKALKSYKPAGLPEPNTKVAVKESNELEFMDDEE